jgi:hypothetical protein
VAAEHHTFAHKQYTEYRERKIIQRKIGRCGPCPIVANFEWGTGKSAKYGSWYKILVYSLKFETDIYIYADEYHMRNRK